jgi:hypothetical protein
MESSVTSKSPVSVAVGMTGVSVGVVTFCGVGGIVGVDVGAGEGEQADRISTSANNTEKYFILILLLRMQLDGISDISSIKQDIDLYSFNYCTIVHKKLSYISQEREKCVVRNLSL